jgi:tRNA/tmRNA/rRNA uracil-C5-methylase (TrmA/RlmC/RlmD family)
VTSTRDRGAGRRRPRQAPTAGPWTGREIEVEVGPVAHGGHCVARHEGRVLFVRHALPGERVLARVTEDGGGSFCRADAVEVRAASPDRVEPPCPHAGPGRCGGCDWQHATGAAQRTLKAAVVREQLARLAGLDVPVSVQELPGGLLGTRTRVRYAVGADGRTGLRRHRSHELEPVAHCPLGTLAVTAGTPDRTWPPGAEVEVVGAASGTLTVALPPGAGRSATDPPGTGPGRESGSAVAGDATVGERAAGRDWQVAAPGFWQVHPAAADTLAAAVLELLDPRPGETALDLYAGAGLFAGLLAERVGPTGTVVAVEADPRAAADARANTPAAVRASRVTPGLVGGLGVRPDLVVLDPPRAGAGKDVTAAILALRPRAIAYVACDPASFARDLKVALDAGWRLRELRAYDCFPMTHHVETVALLWPPP